MSVLLSGCFNIILFNLYIRESGRFKNHKTRGQGQENRVITLRVSVLSEYRNCVQISVYLICIESGRFKNHKKEGRRHTLSLKYNGV